MLLGRMESGRGSLKVRGLGKVEISMKTSTVAHPSF